MEVRLEAIRGSLARLHALREAAGASGAGSLADADRFAIAEHHVRRAMECALDAARHLMAKNGGARPSSYPELMDGVLRLGVIDAALAGRTRDLTEHRNRLVHLGPEVTPNEIWGILDGPVDCLADFCDAVEAFLDVKEV
jgi:uncharacterized protein YutE (UPF0331/DUF86 family)